MIQANDQGFCKTEPRSSRLHLFGDRHNPSVLDVESGKLFSISPLKAGVIESALDYGDTERAELLTLGTVVHSPEHSAPPEHVKVKAFSLAVAQTCNLGCLYCYAEQGGFGKPPSKMAMDIARASVDRLFEDAAAGDDLTLAFMGGEPLANRETLHAATRYAAEKASLTGVKVGFSMTTNATLIRDEDIELFQEFGFTLTVSIDGLKSANDKLRPLVSGKGSFDKVEEKVGLLLSRPNRAYQVIARVTVTPHNLELVETLTGLIEMGFDSITFSPMLSSPTGQADMQSDQLETLLTRLIQCGELFRQGLERGEILPFANIVTTLKRIHRYQREQYPCGAGGGYMGVSASGDLYACHRFVNEPQGHMGTVQIGVDSAKQKAWLNERNLQNQSPCGECWARYLCSGSCHYEVIKRGRPACDYIRGWLHYCLGLYAELHREQPDLLIEILSS